jgi:hypothetical protein
MPEFCGSNQAGIVEEYYGWCLPLLNHFYASVKYAFSAEIKTLFIRWVGWEILI